MKIKNIAIAIVCSVVGSLAHSSARAQQPVITSLQGNGQLTWTNAAGTNGFSIEWAPSLAGPWSSSWRALDSLVATGAQSTVSVPMFFRVKQGFSTVSYRGTWILSGGPQGNVYYTAQEDGTISEVGDFNVSHPAGYFAVGGSGRVTNTVVNLYDGVQKFTGTFANANLVSLDSPYRYCGYARLEDASQCAGNWTGTLSQTNGPNTPASYPVSFNVNSQGLVSNFVGFSGVTIGRMFALLNGTASGFLVSGTWDNNGAYNQVRISGKLTGNTFAGSYWTDSGAGPDGVMGTVSLTRQ